VVDVRLELTPEAIQTYGEMESRCHAIAELCGEGSPEHVEALVSLVRSVGHMLRLGGRITRDGELSLFGASFIAYGLIFHNEYKDGERNPLTGTWSVHS
jgi:hypothetical protein